MTPFDRRKREMRGPGGRAVPGRPLQRKPVNRPDVEKASANAPISVVGSNPPGACDSGNLVAGLHCDSCGAGIGPDTQRCEYCGQVPIILVKGVKLSSLLAMYLEAGCLQEAQDLSSEILTEHPQNPLAWGAKGIVTLRQDSTASGVVRALKCLGIAVGHGCALAGKFRWLAAEACMRRCGEWHGLWRQAYFENSRISMPLNDATKTTFAVVHMLAEEAEKLSPGISADSPLLLRAMTDMDDSMELSFKWVWKGDDQHRNNNNRKQRPNRNRG